MESRSVEDQSTWPLATIEGEYCCTPLHITIGCNPLLLVDPFVQYILLTFISRIPLNDIPSLLLALVRCGLHPLHMPFFADSSVWGPIIEFGHATRSALEARSDKAAKAFMTDWKLSMRALA